MSCALVQTRATGSDLVSRLKRSVGRITSWCPDQPVAEHRLSPSAASALGAVWSHPIAPNPVDAIHRPLAGLTKLPQSTCRRRRPLACRAHGVPIKVVEYQLELAQADIDEGTGHLDSGTMITQTPGPLDQVQMPPEKRGPHRTIPHRGQRPVRYPPRHRLRPGLVRPIQLDGLPRSMPTHRIAHRPNNLPPQFGSYLGRRARQAYTSGANSSRTSHDRATRQ